jgi:hypothetical protein
VMKSHCNMSQLLTRAVSGPRSWRMVNDNSPARLDQMLIDLLASFVNKVRSFADHKGNGTS